MKNGCWGVSSSAIGHQRSLRIITQGHVAKEDDLTIHFDKVCDCYRWYRLPIWEYKKWVLGCRYGGGIG